MVTIRKNLEFLATASLLPFTLDQIIIPLFTQNQPLTNLIGLENTNYFLTELQLMATGGTYLCANGLVKIYDSTREHISNITRNY